MKMKKHSHKPTEKEKLIGSRWCVALATGFNEPGNFTLQNYNVILSRKLYCGYFKIFISDMSLELELGQDVDEWNLFKTLWYRNQSYCYFESSASCICLHGLIRDHIPLFFLICVSQCICVSVFTEKITQMHVNKIFSLRSGQSFLFYKPRVNSSCSQEPQDT